MPVSGINTPDWAVMPTSFWRIVRIRTDFTFNGLSQLNSYFNDCIRVNRDTQFYLHFWENIQKLWKVSIYGYFTIMIVLIVPVVFIFSSVEGQGYPDWLLDSTDFDLFCASLLEGWSTLEAIYFWIITLTTIGFGDYSPNYSQDDSKSSFIPFYRWMIVLFKVCSFIYQLGWIPWNLLSSKNKSFCRENRYFP